ncbi:unnamed protein product [Thlaspi arvense]|uniref:Uncharacterized protein n=1 Tax=Thlaspi arvense TaxID=13288 RepID=A0AAU9S845_THLAR|nr:unnamed protein product [Thlaspi arvense]
MRVLEMESRSTSIVCGKEDMKEEVVRLGVGLSLCVARSMFLLCDHIRSMLWFCYQIWRDANMGTTSDSHVMDRLIRVMHYVYTKYIKPKNGVYQNDGNFSVHWRLIWPANESFARGFVLLNRLVHFLDSGRIYGRVFTSRVEQEVKKVAEMLGCAKGLSEANGFAWDEMESDILDMWKSLCDTEAKEATPTVKAIMTDLFLPLYHEVYPPM